MSGCMTDAWPIIRIQLIKDGGESSGHGTVLMEFLKNGGLLSRGVGGESGDRTRNG